MRDVYKRQALTYAGNTDNLFEIIEENKIEFIKENICNKDGITQILRDNLPDIIINFAAQTHVDRSIDNPDEFIKTNIYGVYVLLDCCLNIGINLSLIHI